MFSCACVGRFSSASSVLQHLSLCEFIPFRSMRLSSGDYFRCTFNGLPRATSGLPPPDFLSLPPPGFLEACLVSFACLYNPALHSTTMRQIRLRVSREAKNVPDPERAPDPGMVRGGSGSENGVPRNPHQIPRPALPRSGALSGSIYVRLGTHFKFVFWGWT